MTKWELARYLIDAKKCVDSVLYIQENAEQLQYIDLRKKIEDLRREFFIKCCTVIDEHIKTANIKKRDLCVEDPIVDRIYYERDKNSAHKDSNYKAREYGSISEICDEMSRQCKHVREVCVDSLPENLTLDFVPHDRSLFRIIHHLAKAEEDEILRRKHPLIDSVNFSDSKESKSWRLFQDTEDLRQIPEEDRKEYAVLMEDGICIYEGLQNRQDGCIKMNVLFGLDTWCSVNKKEFETVQRLTKLGCFDEYGIIQPPPTNPKILDEVLRIMAADDGSGEI